MTLRRKILLGYGIALGLMGVVLAWAILNLVGLGRASDAILRENYRSILAAHQMIDALGRQDQALLLYLLGRPGEGEPRFLDQQNRFQHWLDRAKDNITIEGESGIVTDIEGGYSALLLLATQLGHLAREEPGNAGPFYDHTLRAQFEKVRQACLRLQEINQETMFRASERAERMARTAIWSTSAISFAAVAMGLGFSLLLSKRLVRPLLQIMDAAKRVGEGQYDVEVSPTAADELGLLAGEFNAMAKKLAKYHDMNLEQIIAEKQKSEALLRSIDDGILVVDDQLRITNANTAALRFLGRQSDAVEGRHLLEILKNEQVFAHVEESVRTGRSPTIREDEDILTIIRDETAHYYLYSITPVQSRMGGMPGVVLLLRDVTRLKELDRMKTQFLMTASHELRTPLTSIGMSVDLLLEGAAERLDEKQRQLLVAAHEEVQRLRALVSDLLDLSKIEAGRIDLEKESVPVDMLFERVRGIFEAQVQERRVELSCELTRTLPQVQADANKIAWVLTNLLSNALRYVKMGGHIRLAAERIGAYVQVSVSDDGPGIPREYQSKVFEKFVRVGGEGDSGGTGLGLAICKEIVRAHRGAIWVDSEVGQGSTFTFTLPVNE